MRKFCLAGIAWALSAQGAPLHDIRELVPVATLKLGKTADWVAIDGDSVWVAGSGPFAVHRIDPGTNQVTHSILLPGEPCAGLALGFGKLWVPLCGGTKEKPPPSLAAVDLATRQLAAVYPVGPAAAEGGIAVGDDSVWMVTDVHGSLARIDPHTGTVLNTLAAPPGSYNPHFREGVLWISQVEGAALGRIDTRTGAPLPPVAVGPHPRFLTSGAGAVWTLNQGDGTVTRVDLGGGGTRSIALHTPGHGGDIQYDAGRIWSTMPKVPLSLIDAQTGTLLCQWRGPGGDSLGIGFGALWLTDYHGGTVSRLPVDAAVDKCR